MGFPNFGLKIHKARLPIRSSLETGYKVGPRLRELAPRDQWEAGGGIHATQGPLLAKFCVEKDLLSLLIARPNIVTAVASG